MIATRVSHARSASSRQQTRQTARIQPRGESPGVHSELTFNPEGESLRPYPEFTFDPEEKILGPFHSLTSTTIRPFPASVRHSSPAGFPKSRRGYDVTISPRSKYSSFSGAVLDIDGYLDMSIPTIKYNNLSGYERIPTCKSCRSEEFAPQVTKLQDIYIPRNP